MAKDNATNPWVDTANQAVGALYKYYMSKPTAADAQKQAYMQAQMDRIGVQNEMDERQMALGNYALPNLSPEIRNIMYRDTQTGEAQQIFDAYVRPPMQIDTGDTKYIGNGVTGLPMQEYGVGVAPQTKITDDRIITSPAVPSTNRPQLQSAMAEMFGQHMPTTAVPPPQRGTVPLDDLSALEDQFSFGDPNDPMMMANQNAANVRGAQMGGFNPHATVPGSALPSVPAVEAPTDTMGAPAQVNPSPVPQSVVQPDGSTITELPMSPTDQRKKQERDRLKSIQGDLVNDDIQRALGTLDSAMLPVTGMGGSMMQGIPGTAAHNLSKTLDTIKANIGFDKLQAMREASPTGGALGQVSDFENTQLQAIYGSLAQSQSEEQFRYNLMRLHNTYNDIIHGGGTGDRYDIPTIEKVMSMQTPEDIQGAMEFFNYNPPDEIEQAIVQRANQLGL